jgi:3-oxoacyl-[acyl-carrier-protein] synthase II
MGLVSPIGQDRETFWQSIVKGVSGIRVIERFKNSDKGYKTYIGGEIPDFSAEPFLDKKVSRRMSRFTQMSLVATYKALADAHLTITPELTPRTGVMLGTAAGGYDVLEDQVKSIMTSGLTHLNPFTANASIPSAAAAEISVFFKVTGPNFTIATGCSSSANAIGAAVDMIRAKRADVMITGGSETPFAEVTFSTFDTSKQMSTKNDTPEKAVTPFSLNRTGYVLSEGSAILVLEELEYALKRGAHIYGEIIGYGSSADAYDSLRMEQEGVGMAQALTLALQDADLTPYELDYICAHGSGSKSADLKETNAIKSALGARAYQVPISTIKAVMGMPFGASTGFQVVATALMLEKQIIIPTINLSESDPDCDLDYVPNKAREAVLQNAAVHAMGIGGNNAVLILKRFFR